MGTLLLIISLFLVIVISPFVYFYGLIKSIIKWEINKYHITIAVSLDQLGNVLSCHCFNDMVITKEGYRFGNPDETISSVLGKNKQKGTLRLIGTKLGNKLDKIDENHLEKSIEKDEN